MEIIHLFIQTHNMAFSAIILLIAYFFIATEKIPKVTVALIGATLTLLLGLVGQEKNLHDCTVNHYFANFIDFNVIFLLISMMMIVNIAARSGVFQWVANELLKLTKGNPKLILITLGVLTAVLSAFLDNVTTVILIMPVTFVIAKELGINPLTFFNN